ncbi:MAG: nitrilase-related carbon-nitrogen hydrolase [Planctomycetota bacterium]|jgi:predicted amidohydrolase
MRYCVRNIWAAGLLVLLSAAIVSAESTSYEKKDRTSTSHQAGARANKITVGVAQTVIENTLEGNLAKILNFIDEASNRGCDLIILPENALYWADISTDSATKADIDAAIAQIAERADRADLCVAFGTSHKPAEGAKFRNRGYVFGPDGDMLVSCWKTRDVPESFDVRGVRCNLVICSDRTYLEYSDLPCLVQRSRVIIDISGGHGGDDGRPDMRWIRYRPWAMRTNAYVIVSNPVHDNADFMGNSPWGGGSAIVRPDGSLQACRTHEKDVLIVQEIETDLATGFEAERRKRHAVFGPFWEMGRKLLAGETVEPAVKITPFSSAEREIKIAAAQMACSRDMIDNVGKIRRLIAGASREGADIVVFPELAVTGRRSDDIRAASASGLEDALRQIRSEARTRDIYVIVGMPCEVSGARRNCAFVIDDKGDVITRYAQMVSRRSALLAPGRSIGTMWFKVKGVQSIVTIGDDADWIEIADLAANRGMYLHFHISYESDTSADDTTVRKQRNLLMLRYARYGAVVNAADPSGLPKPSSPAHGVSMIVSREGGHDQASPAGIEYYLPYQTSVVKSAGAGETMIFATRRTAGRNDLDLDRHHRNRSRKSRPQRGWFDWIAAGAALTTGSANQ